MSPSCLSVLLLSTLLAQAPAASRYVVLVDPGPKEQFLPAARSLAEFHKARLLRFDPTKLDAAFVELKKIQPDFVVFVLPPQKIDVDLAHQILERSTRLDDDPFCDFEYGFITGRDGAAALRFVERIQKAWQRDYGRNVALFGSWENKVLPPEQPLTALKAMKAEGSLRLIRITDKEEQRQQAARAALAQCRGKDLLLFFAHGYPDEMVACFRAPDLRQWQVDLSGSILVNCACYNGAPGRWFDCGPKGEVVDRGLVPLDDSVALQILDSGVVGYFGGIDPWHGLLAFQLTGYLFDDGLRLGQAAKRMHDRLALEFLPDRIHFPPTLQNPNRFAGEGTTNRRHNGAGMIFFGDPALAPFAKNASRLRFGKLHKSAGQRFTITLGHRPLVEGTPAQDYMIPMNEILNYYSVKTAAILQEASPEVYRVIPLPPGVDKVSSLKMKSARSGNGDVPTRPPEFVVEKTRSGNFLHVRVPLDVRMYGSLWPQSILRQGIRIELEGEFGS